MTHTTLERTAVPSASRSRSSIGVLSLARARRPASTQAFVLLSGVFVALLVGVWYVTSSAISVIPDPWLTARTLGEIWTDGAFRQDMGVTFLRVVLGIACGAGLGIVVGVLLGFWRAARLVLEPLLIAVYGIPKLLLYPLIIPFLSIGTGSKVFMGAAHCALPSMVIMIAATLAIPQIYLRLGRSMRMSRWETARRLVLPALARPVVAAIRVSLGLAVLGVVYSEFFASADGLGSVLSNAYTMGLDHLVFAHAISLVSLTFLFSLGLWALERRME